MLHSLKLSLCLCSAIILLEWLVYQEKYDRTIMTDLNFISYVIDFPVTRNAVTILANKSWANALRCLYYTTHILIELLEELILYSVHQ